MNSLCEIALPIACQTYPFTPATLLEAPLVETPLLKTPILDAPLVLIHGWANDGQIWQQSLAQFQTLSSVLVVELPGFGLSPIVSDYSLETLLELLHQALPPKCHIVGWSLGAMLSMKLAERFPDQINSLLLLACNAKFVATEDWPAAMSEQTFKGFQCSFEENPAATIKQFHSLQTLSDAQARKKLKQLRQMQKNITINSNWSSALTLLAEIDLRHCMSQLNIPCLMVFGESDQLVPVAAQQAINRICTEQTCTVLVTGCGHLLPWLDSDELKSLLQNFYHSNPSVQITAIAVPETENTDAVSELKSSGRDGYQLDKQKVAASFSSAASSYDDFAQLQRNIGQQLLQRIPISALTDKRSILDLGCGTGYFSEKLQDQCQGQLIGLDLAEGMVNFARQARPQVDAWLCADAELLPLADQSLDGVFSSLAIQWCQQPQQLFTEIKRVLKPGAWATIATLGPDTLCELRQSWAKVDNKVHVNQFIDQEMLLAAAEQANFSTVELECKTELMQYGQLKELTRELKSLGANNRNPGQGSGLQSRKNLLKLKQNYEAYRGKRGAKASKLPASYQVYYLILKA